MTLRFPAFPVSAVLKMVGIALALMLPLRLSAAEANASKAAAGRFKPTREQWAGLKIAEVSKLNFADTVVADGSVAYNDEATTQVFSPYSGQVVRLLARPGDQIRKGAALMVVAASEFVQGVSDLATANANLAAARTVEQRQHALYTAGSGALKDWQQAQSGVAAASAALAAARGRMRILGNTEAEIAQLEQRPSTAEATAVVRAPVAGTVIQRQVGVGQYVQSAAAGAATPAFTIANLSSVWLIADVREADAAAVHVGENAQAQLPGLPGRTFGGRIAWVSSSLDATTHRLPVRVEVANPDAQLKPQMFAAITIMTGRPVAAPAVPQGALMFDGDVARAFVVTADGSIEPRILQLGHSSRGMVEVRSGLRAGEQVISAGTLFIDRALKAD